MLIHSEAGDEIADLIARIRQVPGEDVGVVVPAGSRALQTPLNARLLRQLSSQSGKRTSIVSDDPHVQQLATLSGLPVFSSIPAFEHGIEVTSPQTPPSAHPYAQPAGGGVALAPSRSAAAVAPPPAPPPAAPAVPPPRALPPVVPLDEPEPPRNRRPLYFAAAGVAVLGIILFILLSPSATITMTVAATPISVNPTIQGSTDPSAASQGDHLLTQVVTGTAQSSFQATPTGQQNIPAAAATTTETITSTFPIQGTIQAGTQFESGDAGHTIVFGVTKDTYVCVGPSGPPVGCSQTPNDQVPIQAESPGASGNVAANVLTYWPPSQQPTNCGAVPGPSLCGATNQHAAGGGADAKTVTVASGNDVANWNQQVQQLENQLTTQVNTEMQQRAPGKTFAVDPGGNGKSITPGISPQLPTAGAQFSAKQITVTMTGTAVAYDPDDVRRDVLADLQAQVPQGYQLAAGKLAMQPVVVTQAGTDGTVILSVSASDYSQPVINIDGLKAQLAGKSPGDAQRIIQGRVDRVQSVQVSEFPFGLPWLPFFSGRIQIDENFVPISPST